MFKMNILITGKNGFVGKNLIVYLQNIGLKGIGITRNAKSVISLIR